MPLFSSLGVGSGLQLGSLLQQLEKSEQQRLTPLQKQEASYNAKLSAYGKLQGGVDKLQDAAEALGKTSLYESVSVNSDAEAFTASAGTDASPGQYRIQVDQLAHAQSLAADGLEATDEALSSGGSITLAVGDEDAVTIDLDGDQTTLAGIRDAINAADVDVNAAIINDGSDSPYRLVLTSAQTGTDAEMSVTVSDDDGQSGGLAQLMGQGQLTEAVSAQDAVFSVNNIEITSTSNTVEDALPGVTLNLQEVSNSPESLDISRDDDAIKDAFKDFVKAYNSLHSTESKMTAFNGPDADDNGLLLGDSVARRLESGIHRALNSTFTGNGRYYSLAQIGISLQRDGTLEIDDDRFNKAVDENLSDVRAMMTGTDDTPGLGDSMTDALARLSGDDNSLLSRAQDSMNGNIDRVEQRMTRMQDRIDATVSRYRKQFEQLDSLLASMNSTQNYLSQQFAALNNDQS